MRKVFCQKLQKEAEGLEFAPYPGELGQKIFDSISKAAWQDWLARQTMFINEYHLNLMDSDARAFLEKEMQKYLFDGIDEMPDGYVPPES